MRLKWLALASVFVTLSSVSAGEPAKKAKRQATSAVGARSSEPTPQFAAAPSWAEDQKAAATNPKHKDDPFQMLLSSSQEYLTAKGVENFVEYVVQPLNQAGLQAFGNVAIPWNADRTELIVNHISIERDGKTIDALKPDDVTVLRRETKLEQSMFTGIRTVVMPVRGLQVGDKLRVGFTYKTRPGSLGKTEEVQDLDAPFPVGRMVRRLLVSKDLPVRWSVTPGVKDAAPKESAGAIERTYEVESLEPTKSRSFVPERFKHRLIQVSAFQNWGEVAALLAPYFDSARKTDPKSEVSALADKIAAAHKDPHERLLAALRASQDDIRYVAMLLGDGDYKPMKADEVWAQRYGDCKGKSAFLLALLDRLGIQAEPVLAATQFDDGIAQQLPSLAMFDHAYVRAHIGPEVYYLDGTQFGQRSLEELKSGTTVHVLPLTQNADLVTIPDVLPSAPLIETLLVWDARGGVEAKVPFEATLTLRGSAAAEMRQQAALSSDRDKLIDTYKNKVTGVSNDDLEYVSADADAPDGSYVVKFKGSVQQDWAPVEGLKGNRLQLSQSTLTWKIDFDRDGDDAKNTPVAMSFPYWERTIEKVMLPNNGKDFALDAKNVDETVAVSRVTRTVSMEGGVVTATSDFKRLKRELDPASARSAKDKLDQINEEYGYIVSKKKLKLHS